MTQFCVNCSQLEGRKVSSNQFLKVLSTLRVWEICAPDINAAIEVRCSVAKARLVIPGICGKFLRNVESPMVTSLEKLLETHDI